MKFFFEIVQNFFAFIKSTCGLIREYSFIFYQKLVEYFGNNPNTDVPKVTAADVVPPAPDLSTVPPAPDLSTVPPVPDVAALPPVPDVAALPPVPDVAALSPLSDAARFFNTPNHMLGPSNPWPPVHRIGWNSSPFRDIKEAQPEIDRARAAIKDAIKDVNGDVSTAFQQEFQDPGTNFMEGIIDLHHDIMGYLSFLSGFVGYIIYITVFLFRATAHLRPIIDFRHHAGLEIVWTTIPTLIVISIAVPSFVLIYAMDELYDPELTLKAIGSQWYWNYEYRDFYNAVNEYPGVKDPLVFSAFFLSPEVIGNRERLITSCMRDLNTIFLSSYLGVIEHNHFKYFFERFLHVLDDKEFKIFSQDKQLDLFEGFHSLFLRATRCNSQQSSVSSLYSIFRFINDPISDVSINSFEVLPVVLKIESRMLDDSSVFNSFGTKIRLLSTDNPCYLPKNTSIRLLITSTDVLHSWAVPSFGVKMDACPGRLNQVALELKRSGIFYGQCSELCGVNHGFMPIEVRVIATPVFETWIKQILKTGALST